ncbi:MAG: GGDEF domain-containing protein [Betaproteobacteria bacterium]|nr:GGDEF domain-containing protein [Betaproteobacteria bacterium]
MAVLVDDLLRLMVPKAEDASPFQVPSNLPAAPAGYYQRIEAFAKRIRATRSVEQIVDILDEALGETRSLRGDGALALAEDKVRRAELEIEALKAELNKAIELTNVDPLTELLNRRGMKSGFVAEAARSDRHGTPLCIASIDIDDFKRINDSYGHPAGDAALTHLAKVMRTTLRPNDVLARVGGEEFMALLPNSNEQAAFAALNRLLKAVANNVVVCGHHHISVTFTASVAVRAFGEPQEEVEKRLDAALYRAKHSGKNRVMFALAD